MSTPNCQIKTLGTRGPSRAFSGLRVRRGPLSAILLKLHTRARETDAAELLEFALALPIILVMVVGLLDFAHAYSLKQKLANAAREGARMGGSESVLDTTQSSPASVQSIKDDVTTYLQNAGVDTSFIASSMSWTPSPTSVGTYYTTSGGTNYGLKIERNVLITYTDPNNATLVTVPSTRVTLYYPYDWTFGFDQVIKLLVPSANFADPIRIQTDAMMANP
ncbi:MAG TPA: TadE/TadG family type IV pilus assembly protein [Terriglobia bacterium]|nr:TadE/TadG family type IV pilus assembly protein [Terriglobia bacterium]